MSDIDMSGYHHGIDNWRDANTEISRLRDRIAKLEAMNKRLTSRGFEDLHHENETLKAKLDRVRGLQRWDQGEIYGYALGNAPMVRADDGDYVDYDDLQSVLGKDKDDD